LITSETSSGPGPQRLEPEVVEDQEIGPGAAGEALRVGTVGAAAREMLEHLGGVDEENFVAAAAGLVSEACPRWLLPTPGGP
jgi:hypothetical protein